MCRSRVGGRVKSLKIIVVLCAGGEHTLSYSGTHLKGVKLSFKSKKCVVLNELSVLRSKSSWASVKKFRELKEHFVELWFLSLAESR